MKKVYRLRITALRIIGISLLISIIIFWGVKQNPTAISRIRSIFFPSNIASPQKWVLESQKIHTICGHVDSKRAEYHKKGPFQAVIKHYSERVKRVNNQSYLYSESHQDLCDSCRKNQFLGLAERQVAVFRGTPQKPGPVTERIGIDLRKLPEEEIADLQKGIPFKDGKEKLQLLEGLNGLSTE